MFSKIVTEKVTVTEGPAFTQVLKQKFEAVL